MYMCMCVSENSILYMDTELTRRFKIDNASLTFDLLVTVCYKMAKYVIVTVSSGIEALNGITKTLLTNNETVQLTAELFNKLIRFHIYSLSNFKRDE